MQKYLKLSTTYQETNMNLFTSDYKIKKFERIEEIVEEFYTQRMQGYTLRKRYLVSKYKKDFLIILNQIRFISEIIEGKEFKLMQSKEEWISKLKKGGYARYQ
jgi:DNA topoisomerase-2